MVSSDPETLERSVSNTPDFKFATSTFESALPVPSASNVLFVNVNVSDAIAASCASTYALTDCCDGTCVALSLAMLSSSFSAFVILASALAFVKYKFDDPSVISSVLSFVATCAST